MSHKVNSDLSYYQKYLQYKAKYLELKLSRTIKQTGGASKQKLNKNERDILEIDALSDTPTNNGDDIKVPNEQSSSSVSNIPEIKPIILSSIKSEEKSEELQGELTTLTEDRDKWQRRVEKIQQERDQLTKKVETLTITTVKFLIISRRFQMILKTNSSKNGKIKVNSQDSLF